MKNTTIWLTIATLLVAPLLAGDDETECNLQFFFEQLVNKNEQQPVGEQAVIRVLLTSARDRIVNRPEKYPIYLQRKIFQDLRCVLTNLTPQAGIGERMTILEMQEYMSLIEMCLPYVPRDIELVAVPEPPSVPPVEGSPNVSFDAVNQSDQAVRDLSSHTSLPGGPTSIFLVDAGESGDYRYCVNGEEVPKGRIVTAVGGDFFVHVVP